MTLSSSATSAMARSSDSVTRLAADSPVCPINTLARPIRIFEIHRTGGNPMTPATSGADHSAAVSGWWTAQFFGTASKMTKMTTTSNSVAAAMPNGPKRLSASTPMSVAEISWQMSTHKSTGLRKSCGCSTSRASVGAPCRPSSTNPLARALLMRTRDVSAIAKTPEAASRTMTAMMRPMSPVENAATITAPTEGHPTLGRSALGGALAPAPP